MKLISIVLVLYLWSWPLASFAKLPPAFQIVKGFSDVPGATIEVENMPRIRSQGSFSVCAGFSAATIAQKKACDNNKDKFPDCSKIPFTKEISPFSMLAWASSSGDNVDRTDYSNFMSLRMSGNSGSQALFNSEKLFAFMPESCYPFDQIANKYGNNKEAGDLVIKRLKEIYNSNRRKTEGAAAICEDCIAKEVNEILGTKANAELIASALKEESFAEFLHTVTFGVCRMIRFNPKPKFVYFPKSPEEGKRVNLLPKIKEILASGNPVHYDGMCFLRDESTDKCIGFHSFVISGYKKVCSPLNQCRELVKVHNSWGEEWQRLHNDGWVDAQSIIDNTSDDEPVISNGTLSWLE